MTDVPPALAISGPSTVDLNTAYTLTLSATSGPDPLSAWNITWGDGGTTALGGNASSATHTYTVASKYTITATGTTDDGTLAANQQVVTINNMPPTVKITGPSSSDEGSLYTLNLIGILSSGTINSWSITWGDNSTSNPSGNPASATHTYADGPHNYTITATATDNSNNTYNAGSVTVTVNNVAPTVTPAASQTQVKNAAFTVQVGTFTDPGFTSASAGTQETLPGAITHLPAGRWR